MTFYAWLIACDVFSEVFFVAGEGVFRSLLLSVASGIPDYFQLLEKAQPLLDG